MGVLPPPHLCIALDGGVSATSPSPLHLAFEDEPVRVYQHHHALVSRVRWGMGCNTTFCSRIAFDEGGTTTISPLRSTTSPSYVAFDEGVPAPPSLSFACPV